MKRTPFLVQPFLAEVAAEGEYSFLFFGGEFSHAVLKRPAAGDFRVQHNHGGSTESVTASAEDVAQARAVLAAAGADTAYARVDMIRHEGRLLLGELELTEPFLFLGYHPDAPERFATALVARLTQ